jgi:glycolate oxidase FAD binding subunit
MKLHFGALGTLGVIVAASFKVFPRPLHDITVETRRESIDEAWSESDRARRMPLPPSALEMFSDGRVLARFLGSPDAVERMVRELDWTKAAPSVWAEHSRRAPERWARIAVPRHEMRSIIASLPVGAEWWASPGVGAIHWSATDAQSARDVRVQAEAAGGSLVIMAAPAEFTNEVGAWGTTPPTIELMRRLRKAFDPNGTLNPGRFVV